ncbi:hypothetical protein [Frigoriglobus tundricola]|uniref:FCP1 homology domain-containing protein n=1 Tax=Frigoriglobus tundricola TaxID=2774151 RepID=A0A6M5YQW6_9BACT|nr:hypothetical protein [Frigoriglobus tundricola]QJW95810.1 hypothetical protein FTUN_3364 [Frigoriglobus tundricola]
MRISFDLDDTLICYQPGALHEPPRSRWWPRLWRGEPLRSGAATLLADLAAGHELWVYTTSYRHPQTVSWWLWGYGVRVRYVINQYRHEQVFGRRGRSKHPAAFGIRLHVDDSWGVWLENRFERNVCVVLPDDPDWAQKVRDAVARVARNEVPAPPPDLPEEYRAG